MSSAEEQKKIFEELKGITTEQRNPHSMDIDSKSTREILKIINDEDKTVPLAVEKELDYIAKGVDLIVEAIKKGGRLLYFCLLYTSPSPRDS